MDQVTVSSQVTVKNLVFGKFCELVVHHNKSLLKQIFFQQEIYS